MPRSPKPTELVIKETLRLAALLGRDRYTDIQRGLEQKLEFLREEEGVITGKTPDTRTIKWIVKDYINELPVEVVMAEFSASIWSLRDDYQELKKIQRQQYSTTFEAGTRPDLETQHFRDVKEAIKVWSALIEQPEPSFNAADIGGAKYLGFGLTWGKAHDGIAVKLAFENEGLLTLLSKHLISPVVDADFWQSVDCLKENGVKYLTAGRQLGEAILAASKAETGLDVVLSWQREPEVGLTEEFVGTISRNALGLQKGLQYAYSELAIAYLKKGIMVTQVSEGLRLMQGKGLDPTFKATHISTAGAWVIPQGNQRLVCDGAIEPENESTARALLFVLQLHGYAIAVGPLDRIKTCCEVHQHLMRRYANSPEAKAVLIAQSNLKEKSETISGQLKKASLYLQYPGICPFCPD